MCYDYNTLVTDIKNITDDYGFIDTFSIGQSVMGKDIPCLKFGTGEKKLFIGGAYHGLEYLTSAFLMKFLSGFTVAFMTKNPFFGYNVKKLYKKVTVYILPMVNPDGVDIAIHGLDITNPYHRDLISLVGIHSFNNVWQANVRGVDLNHNYDAKWSMVIDHPSPSKHGGEYPESEPETKAVTEFITDNDIDMVLAFHSQGSEIYYDFDGMAGEKSRKLAKKMAKESGYAVCIPTGTAAYGGCKDWFIKKFGRDGFTVEIGKGKNPLPLSMFDDVYEDNARIILSAMEEI